MKRLIFNSTGNRHFVLGAQSGSLLSPAFLSSVFLTSETDIRNLRQKPRGPQGTSFSHLPVQVFCLVLCAVSSSPAHSLCFSLLLSGLLSYIPPKPCSMTQKQGVSWSLNLSPILHCIVTESVCINADSPMSPRPPHTPIRAISLQC